MAKHWRHTIPKDKPALSEDELAKQLPDFAKLMQERKLLEEEMKSITGQQNESSSLPFTPEIPSMQQRKRDYAKWQKKRDKKRLDQVPKSNTGFTNLLSNLKLPNRSKRSIDPRFQNDINQVKPAKTKKRKEKTATSRRAKKQIDSLFEIDDFKRAKRKTDELMGNQLIQLKKGNSGLETKPREPIRKQVDKDFSIEFPRRFQNKITELRKTIVKPSQPKELKHSVKLKNKQDILFNRPAKANKRLRKKKVDALFSISTEDKTSDFMDALAKNEELKKAKLKELKSSQAWESSRDKKRFAYE